MKYSIEITIGKYKFPYGFRVEAQSEQEAIEKAKQRFTPSFKINEINTKNSDNQEL